MVIRIEVSENALENLILPNNGLKRYLMFPITFSIPISRCAQNGCFPTFSRTFDNALSNLSTEYFC